MSDEITEISQLKSEMLTRFGIGPNDVRIVRSPYRICPLGAHIDHQLGPVTAMAIDRAVYLAYAPTEGTEVHLESLTFEGKVDFDLKHISPRQEEDWGNFPRGAAQALLKCHSLKRGIVGITSGRMAEGGLSSSAAVGVAYLLALEDVNDIAVSIQDNIQFDQMIENEYLGLKNGILDQSAILFARKNHLSLIDCKEGAHSNLPRSKQMAPFAILIVLSGLKKALVSTGYNERVTECAKAATDLLQSVDRTEDLPLLGNITSEEYRENKARLEGPIARRAKHFFSEVERVREGVQAWKSGDLETFGRLISESGNSSIVNYECGSRPLIDLYDILNETEGVLGARFSGGGFRGCCVALINPKKEEQIRANVKRQYSQKHPDLVSDSPTFVCQSDDGACIL